MASAKGSFGSVGRYNPADNLYKAPGTQGVMGGKAGAGAAPAIAGPAPPKVDFNGLLSQFGMGGTSAAPQPAKGAYTQKNGKWYDPTGQEVKVGSSGTWEVVGGGGGAQGKGVVGPGGAGAAPGVDLSNTAQKDPRLEFLANKVTDRINNPQQSEKRAIDAVGSSMRDLATGQGKELAYRGAASGTLDSGQQEAGQQQIQEDVRGKVAGAARDISLKRAEDNDAFLLDSQGALSGPGAAARADREMALRQWIEGNTDRRAEEQSQLARFSAISNLLSNLGGMV